SQGSSIAKAAEVASQMVRPSRLAGIQSPLGTFTPLVVPFHTNTASWAGLYWLRSGNWPYGALKVRASLILSCFTVSVTQSSEKLSQANRSTGRGPSIDHSALSTAPVSEAGTMPQR